MRSPLQRVPEDLIGETVAAGWGLEVAALRYVPEGGGAYHWVAEDHHGRPWFVTCDDLDTKPWLGKDRDAVFDSLRAVYGAATDARRRGLSFVVAPIAARSGEPTERIDDRHCVSVLPYVDGEPGRWGRPLEARGAGELVSMLARLHSTPPAEGLGTRGLDIPGRAGLDAALDDVDRRWSGGPLSEPTRRLLTADRTRVVEALAALDRVAAGELGDTAVVLTHGEPHPGNLIRTDSGLALIDWDTLAMARPERDLWMLADGGVDVVPAYRQLTGVTLDDATLRAFRLLWALADVAAFTAQLRGEHRLDADGRAALAALRSILAGREPDPYGRREPSADAAVPLA